MSRSHLRSGGPSGMDRPDPESDFQQHATSPQCWASTTTPCSGHCDRCETKGSLSSDEGVASQSAEVQSVEMQYLKGPVTLSASPDIMGTEAMSSFRSSNRFLEPWRTALNGGLNMGHRSCVRS